MLARAPGCPNILVAGTGPQPLEDPKRTKPIPEHPNFVVVRPDSRRVNLNEQREEEKASRDRSRPWTSDGNTQRGTKIRSRPPSRPATAQVPGEHCGFYSPRNKRKGTCRKQSDFTFRPPHSPKGGGTVRPHTTGAPVSRLNSSRTVRGHGFNSFTDPSSTWTSTEKCESPLLERLQETSRQMGQSKSGDALQSVTDWLTQGIEGRCERTAEIHRFITADERTLSDLLQLHDDMPSDSTPEKESFGDWKRNQFSESFHRCLADTAATEAYNGPLNPSVTRESEKASLRSARVLWDDIPKEKRNPSDREEALTLAKAMDIVMCEIGAPLRVCRPPELSQPGQSSLQEAEAVQELRKWNAAEPIAPEIHVLDRVLQELVRQTGVHCWERGQLLQRVRVRYWNILEEAISMTLLLKRDIVMVRKQVRDLLQNLETCEEDKEHIRKQLQRDGKIISRQREELKKSEIRIEDMNRRLRRGRFDILEEELYKYKYQLDKQTVDFVERTKRAMEEEYKEKLRQAAHNVPNRPPDSEVDQQ